MQRWEQQSLLATELISCYYKSVATFVDARQGAFYSAKVYGHDFVMTSSIGSNATQELDLACNSWSRKLALLKNIISIGHV